MKRAKQFNDYYLRMAEVSSSKQGSEVVPGGLGAFEKFALAAIGLCGRIQATDE